jgi:uncharacterized protein YbjQ (UPF0145 family)
MAIICCLCGKKQSGFITDFPLSERDTQDRICSACEERKQAWISAIEFHIEDYSQYKGEFLSYVTDITPQVQQALNFLIVEIDSRYAAKFESQKQQILQKQEQKAIKLAYEEAWNQKYYAMKMTSGFNFEGYRITKYIKVISGETVLGTGFLSEFSAGVANLFGVETDKFAKKFEQAKDSALKKLISNAVELDANALIGVDFDYPLIYNNIIAVIASATAVVVEKEEE